MESIAQSARAHVEEDGEAKAVLAAAPLFADAPPAALNAIAAASVEKNIRAGETLFTVGQYDGQEFFYVASGRMKIARASADGAMLIEWAGAGEFYGLAAAVCGTVESSSSTATMTADKDAHVVCIDSAAFRAVVSQRPTLTKMLMQHFAAALVAAPKWREDDAAPERRIFAALLEHVERDAKSGEWRVARMPKHRELAEKAGTEEADVAAAVARLIQDGAARRDYPGLVIVDIQSLSRLAN